MNVRPQTHQKTNTKPLFVSTRSGLVQRTCACGQYSGSGGECESCRKKREGMLQRVAVNLVPVHNALPIVHDVLRSSGQPLDANTRRIHAAALGMISAESGFTVS